MGLFASVLHLDEVDRDRLLPELDTVLSGYGFARAKAVAIPKGGPYKMPDHERAANVGPVYFVSPLAGRWLTMLEGHFALRGAPRLAEVGNRLSKSLSCYALTLVVHDDDLFLYNLDHRGRTLGRYNSCPQYFEPQRLPEPDVEAQRHNPEPFAPLLPPKRKLEQLRALLGRGWWDAHDKGRLDEHGVPKGRGNGFVFEGERMTKFGTLLGLHGGDGDYPYAAWGGDSPIDWASFVAVRYRAAAKAKARKATGSRRQ